MSSSQKKKEKDWGMVDSFELIFLLGLTTRPCMLFRLPFLCSTSTTLVGALISKNLLNAAQNTSGWTIRMEYNIESFGSKCHRSEMLLTYEIKTLLGDIEKGVGEGWMVIL